MAVRWTSSRTTPRRRSPSPRRDASWCPKPRTHAEDALMAARAGIVITGTEVLNGVITDRNGPWLSERLREIGVELAHITIVGDRPEDMTSALRFMADEGVDL